MSDEEKNSIDLYLHQETKIEKIQDGMTTFLKEQLNAGGKIDRLMDNQTHMQNRMDKSSETGFKTFEMVKGIVSDVGGIKTKQEHQDKRLDNVEGFNSKYLVGMLVVAVSAIVTSVITLGFALVKLRALG